MTEATAARGRLHLDPDAVAAFSRARGESSSMNHWRVRAARVLADAAYPDRVRHLWRYTDPDRFLPAGDLLAAAPADSDDQVAVDDAPCVVLAPGRAPSLNAAAASCGLEIVDLAAADVDDHLGRAVPAEHGWFEALNAAAWNTGVVIRAPRDLDLADPLRVVVPARAGGDLVPRLLVIAEPGSRLTVVEDHTGGDPGAVVVGVTEILAAANSEVGHVLVQRWQEGVRGHLTQRAVIDRDARFRGATAGLGGAVAKVDQGGVLAGPGARSELTGVTLPERRQHLDHHTVHRHTSGHTSSNIDFKVAVADRARSAYTGLIRIEQDAGASEAFQENRNLLLSERARADTIPELEILTDDVSCSHGATAAPIDPDQLFYLACRGIPAGEARRLVVRGFVESTLRQMPEHLRDEIERLIDVRLERLATVA